MKLHLPLGLRKAVYHTFLAGLIACAGTANAADPKLEGITYKAYSTSKNPLAGIYENFYSISNGDTGGNLGCYFLAYKGVDTYINRYINSWNNNHPNDKLSKDSEEIIALRQDLTDYMVEGAALVLGNDQSATNSDGTHVRRSQGYAQSTCHLWVQGDVIIRSDSFLAIDANHSLDASGHKVIIGSEGVELHRMDQLAGSGSPTYTVPIYGGVLSFISAGATDDVTLVRTLRLGSLHTYMGAYVNDLKTFIVDTNPTDAATANTNVVHRNDGVTHYATSDKDMDVRNNGNANGYILTDLGGNAIEIQKGDFSLDTEYTTFNMSSEATTAAGYNYDKMNTGDYGYLKSLTIGSTGASVVKALLNDIDVVEDVTIHSGSKLDMDGYELRVSSITGQVTNASSFSVGDFEYDSSVVADYENSKGQKAAAQKFAVNSFTASAQARVTKGNRAAKMDVESSYDADSQTYIYTLSNIENGSSLFVNKGDFVLADSTGVEHLSIGSGAGVSLGTTDDSLTLAAGQSINFGAGGSFDGDVRAERGSTVLLDAATTATAPISGKLAMDGTSLNFSNVGTGSGVAVSDLVLGDDTNTVTVNGTGDLMSGTTYTLMSYDSCNVSENLSGYFSLTQQKNGAYTYALTLDETQQAMMLAVDVVEGVHVWKGGETGTWSNATTDQPWQVDNAKDYFETGDSVLFESAKDADSVATVSGTVAPGDITVSGAGNTTWQADATDGGTIAASGTLTKQGSGTLTIEMANSFAGGTCIYDGTVAITNAAALAGGGVMLEGGALVVAEGDMTVAKATQASITTQDGGIEVAADTLGAGNTLEATGDIRVQNISSAGNTLSSTGGSISITSLSQDATGTTVSAAKGSITLAEASTLSADSSLAADSITLNEATLLGSVKATAADEGTGSLTMEGGSATGATLTAAVYDVNGSVTLTDSTLNFRATSLAKGDSLNIEGSGAGCALGSTTVDGGALNIGTDGTTTRATTVVGDISVSNGGSFTLAGADAANQSTVKGDVSLEGGVSNLSFAVITGKLAMDGSSLCFSNVDAGSEADVGELELGDAPNTVEVKGMGDLAAGATYTLMTYDSCTTSGGSTELFTLTKPANSAYTYSLTQDATALTLAVSLDGGVHVWNAGTEGTWSTDTSTQNWLVSGTDDYFTTGDTVLFEPAKDASTVVTVNGVVAPNNITVAGAGNTTWKGNGAGICSIAASGTLTKLGTGTLTIEMANSFTGGTCIYDGTVAITNADALGGGGVTLEGGALVVAAGDMTVASSAQACITTQDGGIEVAADTLGAGNTLVASGDISVKNISSVGNTLSSTGGSISINALSQDATGTSISAAEGSISLAEASTLSADSSLSAKTLDVKADITAYGAVNLSEGTDITDEKTLTISGSSGNELGAVTGNRLELADGAGAEATSVDVKNLTVAGMGTKLTTTVGDTIATNGADISATLENSAGNISLSQASITGSVSASATGEGKGALTMSGGTAANATLTAEDYVAEGSVTLTGSKLDFSTTTVSTGNSLSITGAPELAADTPSKLGTAKVDGGALSIGTDGTTTSATTVQGNIAVSNGGTLTLTGESATQQSEVQGDVRLSSAKDTLLLTNGAISGTVSADKGSTVNVDGANKLGALTLTDGSHLTWVAAASLTLGSELVIEGQSDATIGQGGLIGHVALRHGELALTAGAIVDGGITLEAEAGVTAADATRVITVSGTVDLTRDAASRVNTHALTLQKNGSVKLLGSDALAASLTVGCFGGTATLDITGTGDITFGTAVEDGTPNHTGDIIVNNLDGTLSATATNSLGTAGTMTFAGSGEAHPALTTAPDVALTADQAKNFVFHAARTVSATPVSPAETVTLSGKVTGTGALHLVEGDLTLTGAGNNLAAATVAAGSKLTLDHTATDNARYGTLTNAGTLKLTNSQVGTLSNEGESSVTGGTLGAISNEQGNTLVTDAVLLAGGTITNGDDDATTPAAELTLKGVSNAGMVAGTLTNKTDGTLALGKSDTAASHLTVAEAALAGSVTVTGGSSLSTTGKMSVSGTTVLGDATVADDKGTLAAAGTEGMDISGSVTGTGELSAQAGTLAVTGQVDIAGSIEADTLAVGSAAGASQPGSVTVTGRTAVEQVDVTGGADVVINSTQTDNRLGAGTVSGAGSSLTINGKDATGAAAGTFAATAITVAQGGELVLDHALYNGNVVVNGYDASVASSAASTLTMTNATVKGDVSFSGDNQFNIYGENHVYGELCVSSGTVTSQHGSVTVHGAAGGDALVVEGTYIIENDATYTGDVLVKSGALEVQGTLTSGNVTFGGADGAAESRVISVNTEGSKVSLDTLTVGKSGTVTLNGADAQGTELTLNALAGQAGEILVLNGAAASRVTVTQSNAGFASDLALEVSQLTVKADEAIGTVGTLRMADGTTLATDAATALTLSKDITGAQNFSLSTANGLTLSGKVTGTGALHLVEGDLTLTGAGNNLAAATVAAGSKLTLDHTATDNARYGTLTNAGTLKLTNSQVGTLSNEGESSVTGGTLGAISNEQGNTLVTDAVLLAGGTITNGDDDATTPAAELTLKGVSNAGMVAGTLTNKTDGTLALGKSDTAASHLTVAEAALAGSVTVTGGSSLSTTGKMSVSGTTVLGDATVADDKGTLAAAGTEGMDISGSVTGTGELSAQAGTLAVTGQVDIAGSIEADTLAVGSAAGASQPGSVTVTGRTAVEQVDVTGGADVVINSTQTDNRLGAGTVSGAGSSLTINGKDATGAAAGTFAATAITVAQGGELVLDHALYNGNVVVNGYDASVASSAASTLTMTNATVKGDVSFSGDNQFNIYGENHVYGELCVSSGTVTSQHGSVTVHGAAGGDALVVEGTYIIENDATYTGDVLVKSGALEVQGTLTSGNVTFGGADGAAESRVISVNTEGSKVSLDTLTVGKSGTVTLNGADAQGTELTLNALAGQAGEILVLNGAAASRVTVTQSNAGFASDLALEVSQLTVKADEAIGTVGTLRMADGTTLATDAATALTLSKDITGAQDITLSTAKGLTLAGDVAVHGTLTKAAGGDLRFAGNTLTAETVELGDGSTLTLDNAAADVGNVVISKGALEVTNGSTLDASDAEGNNTVTLKGATAEAAQLHISGTELETGVTLAVADKGTLQTDATTTLAGELTGSAAAELVKTGSEALVLDHGNSGFAGTLVLTEGRIVATAAEALGSGSVQLDQSADTAALVVELDAAPVNGQPASFSNDWNAQTDAALIATQAATLSGAFSGHGSTITKTGEMVTLTGADAEQTGAGDYTIRLSAPEAGQSNAITLDKAALRGTLAAEKNCDIIVTGEGVSTVGQLALAGDGQSASNTLNENATHVRLQHAGSDVLCSATGETLNAGGAQLVIDGWETVDGAEVNPNDYADRTRLLVGEGIQGFDAEIVHGLETRNVNLAADADGNSYVVLSINHKGARKNTFEQAVSDAISGSDSESVGTGGRLDELVDAINHTDSEAAARDALNSVGGAGIATTMAAQMSANRDHMRTLRGAIGHPVQHDTWISGKEAPQWVTHSNLWAMATGATAELDEDSEGGAGYTRHDVGFLVGADVTLGRSTLVGLATGYSRSTVDSTGHTITGDQYFVDVYARRNRGRFSQAATLGVGVHDWSIERMVQVKTGDFYADFHGKGEGQAKGMSVNFSYEAAYTFRFREKHVLSPLFTLESSWNSLDGYRENGTLGNAGLDVEFEDACTTTLGLGARYSYDFEGFGSAEEKGQLAARAMFIADVGDVNGKMSARIIGSGAGFDAESAEISRTGFLLGVDALVPVSRRWSLFGNASAEFRSDYTDLSAGAGVKYTF